MKQTQTMLVCIMIFKRQYYANCVDNFIDDHFDDEDIDGTDNKDNIPISRLALTCAVESAPNHGFIGYLLDKYRNNEGSSELPKETNSQLTESKHSISHEGIRDHDWSLFDVPVKDGTEELIVYTLSYQAGSKHIHSAFASVVFPGHIYVEAHNISDIQAVTSIYQDVYSKYIRPVPTEHTWVRLKGKYHYDLTFIMNVEVIPTMTELRAFQNCRHVPAQILDHTRCAILASSIQIGDQDIQEDSATLRLANSHTGAFIYLLSLLQKCFKLGDGVRVISGEHKGLVGMVINSEPYGRIGEDNVMIVTFPLKKCNHIKVLSSNLDFCDEVHQNMTFRWQDSDFGRFSARRYIITKAGPLKGELGILQDVNFNGIAVVEIQTHLMTSNCCENLIPEVFLNNHYLLVQHHIGNTIMGLDHRRLCGIPVQKLHSSQEQPFTSSIATICFTSRVNGTLDHMASRI
ncbi:hypothetical protein BDQ17DRAFT_1336730 [Cyathus striatus]|nr:hypothetical protein BDQ17DRAFT_1336730 [Cyathus striatus]